MEAVGRPDFGALLKQFRLEVGITQQQLAERARLSIEAIGTLERGARKRPQRATVALLARALELSPQRRETLLESAAAVLHPPRRREQSEALHESRLRLVRSETQTGARHNLSQQLTSFVGRQRELSEIAALLREHRLVTIVGAGGVGKSRTGLQVGAALMDSWPDGVRVVELAPLADGTLVAGAVLSTLHVSVARSDSALDALVAYLKTRRLLLILDNCEHVIAEVRSLAAAIAQKCPYVPVLSTSREPLNVSGERVYRLPSLAVPPNSKRTAQDALSYGAVALFADRALAVDRSFALTDDNAPAIGEICRRLDGIPLAIELAAARMNVLAPTQIAKKLDERFRLLTDGDRRALPRHQTMRALVDWSYDSLTPREQRFFESLSVFAGGCTLDSMTAVCADDNEDDVDLIDVLASLVSKSLLVAELAGTEQRYYLLESSRQYAREKLVAHGEQEAVAQRHALAYLDLAERLEEAQEMGPDEPWLEQVEPEYDNWRAALAWSLAARNDVETGQRMASALWGMWAAPVVLSEGPRWVKAGLDAVDHVARGCVVAQLKLTWAKIQIRLHRHEAALAAARRAMVLYREVADPAGIAKAQLLEGLALIWLGQIAAGEALLLKALLEARALEKRRLLGGVLEILGFACQRRGDVNGARQRFTEALAIWEAAGSGSRILTTSLYLAETEFIGGDAAKALQLALGGLAARGSRADVRTVGSLLINCAAYLVALGRYDEAGASAREALDFLHDVRDKLSTAIAAQHLAAIATLRPYRDYQSMQSGFILGAKLLGFVDATLVAESDGSYKRDYGDEQEHGLVLKVLLQELGADELAKLRSEGASMSEEQAVAEANAIA